jgi:hypothetical protein
MKINFSTSYSLSVLTVCGKGDKDGRYSNNKFVVFKIESGFFLDLSFQISDVINAQ